MEYTVLKLAKLAGVSTRTLRYYDELGLLKPARINGSGYRIYGTNEVDQLQLILFYRSLEMSLEDILKMMSEPDFNALSALREHQQHLLEKQKQLNQLIENVNQTIESKERGIQMKDADKFEGLKKKKIEDNEATYGKEIREKYGDAVIDQTNVKIQQMSEAVYESAEVLEKMILKQLKEAFQTGDPAGPLAQEVAALHKKWLCYYWTEYSKAAHAGMAQMYVADERFTAYYDKEQPGLAQFLKEAIEVYTR